MTILIRTIWIKANGNQNTASFWFPLPYLQVRWGAIKAEYTWLIPDENVKLNVSFVKVFCYKVTVQQGKEGHKVTALSQYENKVMVVQGSTASAVTLDSFSIFSSGIGKIVFH